MEISPENVDEFVSKLNFNRSRVFCDGTMQFSPT